VTHQDQDGAAVQLPAASPAYTASRCRCAVDRMPGGTWQVSDCAATEHAILTAGRVRRGEWRRV
jgi:hypothetical protein